MKVTENLARYILSLQRFKESELGLDEEDNTVIQLIEADSLKLKLIEI
jgi:hypothetical protein